MDIKTLSPALSVCPQITPNDVAALAAAGFKSIVCNRPDGEGADQTNFSDIERVAQALGLATHYLPVVSGKVSAEDGVAFGRLLATLPAPVLAYCRSGTRSSTLWALCNAHAPSTSDTTNTTATPGTTTNAAPSASTAQASHAIVIVGGGAAGIATAASLLARSPTLDIAIIEPKDTHYYQPGWTMVGGGIFQVESTARSMSSVMPHQVKWIRAAVAAFEPTRNAVVLEDGRSVQYEQLIVCPGLKLHWDGIEGLSDTLGRNGVTSNYRYDLAPYTWELVQQLQGGKVIFTQPPMPIKCAGAPQKAMYLAASYWQRHHVLRNIHIDFCNAGAVLFGVADYVPALMEYVKAYGIDLHFGRTLVSVNGPARQATFRQPVSGATDGSTTLVTQDFDMLHVVPPQTAPDFVRSSPLADAAGWVDIDPATMRHKTYANVFALGDVGNTTNAKTAAAARKQAPVVAHNVLAARGQLHGQARYDGYGSCPLTVERGKIVLAEFTYGGKLAPSFPQWLINGKRPSALAWFLKERILPPLYWHGMLKGHEWLAKPHITL